MAFDFTTLQTDFFSRGFDYLNDAGTGLAKAKRLLNQAMHEINGEEPWPFLEASAAGTAPVTIADASGQFESVWDTTNDQILQRISRVELQQRYGDNLDDTGTPSWWYRTNVGVVNVYPVQTVSLSVRYYKVGTDMSAGSDTPLMPDRFRVAISALAAAQEHRTNGEARTAASHQQEAQRVVDKMRLELLGEEPQHVPYIGDD